MAFTTLIDTATLAEQLSDAAVAIVDCRFRLDDIAWGEREYETRHVPGAVYAHLDRDLSGPKTGTNGRHPLPAPNTLASTLGRLGIGNDVQVVAYDQDSGMYASRLWWLLRWLGHDAVAVLDGGFAKWTAEMRPSRSGTEMRPAREFRAAVRTAMVASIRDVEAAVGAADSRLLDARAPERFRGDVEPLDSAAGHIPGATNHHFLTNLDARGTFRSSEDLRARFAGSLLGASPDRVISYCGSGVTACHNLLGLEHAGLPGAKLYPGSWSEWSSDPNRPIEKGMGFDR
jgi:thiosulfate/3-mercaptopyruvate sulfurtransferase